MFSRSPIRFVLLVPLWLVLTACASMIQQSRNAALDRVIGAGDYAAAALLAEDRLGLKAKSPDALPPVRADRANVLNHLEAAEAWDLAGNTERALAHFDAAETALKAVETQNAASSGAKQLGAALLNDSLLDYVPSPAEAVLMNYEKAVLFWGRGDIANARVEFNRADERTRRAVERYQSEIAQVREAAQQRDLDDGALSAEVAARFPEMRQWQPYREFILPASVYLQALFLAQRGTDGGDRNKAYDLYRRVVGVVGEHPVIEAELQEIQRGKPCPGGDCLWVVVEHGLGPELQESHFDLPLPLHNGTVIASLALPRLVSRNTDDRVPFEIRYGDRALTPVLYSSMDRVVQTEFEKRWPAIVTRAVISSSAKAVAQYVVNDHRNDNPYAGLINVVASLAAAASTSADVRMWRSMPSRWNLARVPRQSGASLRLGVRGVPEVVNLPAKGDVLVYIKAPNGDFKPKVSVLQL